MKLIASLVVVISFVAVAYAQGTDHENIAVVKVAVSDTFGDPVPNAQVTLTSIGPKEKFTAAGGEARLDRIPFGLYDLDVRSPGFLIRKEQVRVYQPTLTFRIGLELAPTHVYERPELDGLVDAGIRGRPDLWVRLVALYSGDFIENAVDNSGEFKLEGMAVGKYLLVLFERDKVLAMKPVGVRGGKQAIDVALASK